MAAPAAAAPARLSAAGEAALKAEFGKAYDGVRLRASLQADIVAHFAGRGLGVTDVKDMLMISKNFPERSERIWEKLLKDDIGVAAESEVSRRWNASSSGSTRGSSARRQLWVTPTTR